MDVISPSCDASAQPRWALGRPVTIERDAFIGRFKNRLAPSLGQNRFHQVPPEAYVFLSRSSANEFKNRCYHLCVRYMGFPYI